MRVIIAEKQVKKINWNLSSTQFKLSPDRPGSDAVKVSVIFEYDPETPANVKVKQVLRETNQEDLLPQLSRFDLPALEREISEKIALQDVNFDDLFWQSGVGSRYFDNTTSNKNWEDESEFRDIFP